MLLLVASALLPAAYASSPGKGCHCLPSDSCWPDKSAWDALNATVGGRLIATVPIASVCHDPHYDKTICSALRSNWTLPPTQCVPCVGQRTAPCTR